MLKFELNIAFSDEQLKAIYETNTNVIIAKPTSGADPNVAWQSFKPMQTNRLTWEENYGIYVSTAQMQHGAILEQLSSVPVPAASHKLYTLEPSGVIVGPEDGGAANSYALKNKYELAPYMTVGLFQDATVNGIEIKGNALSAAPVLTASTSVMTPYTQLYIWLQSKVESNTVVTKVNSPMTPLMFGGNTNNIYVSYDSITGQFLIEQPPQ